MTPKKLITADFVLEKASKMQECCKILVENENFFPSAFSI
jgi:hypothetical protein